MVKLAITGKADKRILAYPLMRACAIAGKTCVITDDAGYKRLYEGKDNHGVIEGIEINIVPTMDADVISRIEMSAKENDIDYLIYLSDSYYSEDTTRTLMLCEYNSTFLGETIEDLSYEHDNIVFGTLTLEPRKKLVAVPKDVKVQQIGWKPEYSIYLHQIEEKRELLPMKDKAIITMLTSTFSECVNMTPAAFSQLLKRSRHQLTKNK